MAERTQPLWLWTVSHNRRPSLSAKVNPQLFVFAKNFILLD